MREEGLESPDVHSMIQSRLAELGHYEGPIDGQWGPATQAALDRFARQEGLPEGEVSVELLRALLPDANIEAHPLRPLSLAEWQQHRPYHEAIQEAFGTEREREAFANAFMDLGLRSLAPWLAMDEEAGDDRRAIIEHVEQVFLAWILGERMTERFDEDERRVQFAKEVLSLGQVYRRWACLAILKLPDGHPERDDRQVLATLRECLEEARETGDRQMELLLITNLLEYRLEDPEIGEERIARAEALLAEGVDPDDEANFLMALLIYYSRRAAEAGDDQDQDAVSALIARAEEVLSRLESRSPAPTLLSKGCFLLAIAYSQRESARSAELFAQARDGMDPDDTTFKRAVKSEAGCRSDLGEYDRVIELLEPIIPWLEEQYLTAAEDEEVEYRGADFAKYSRVLAFAYAHKGRWGDAFCRLEAHKSLRLRYRAALRQTQEAESLRRLETKLDAMRRGLDVDHPLPSAVADPVGQRISLMARVMEEYRRQRPQLPGLMLEHVSVADVASALEPDEALLSVGTGPHGTLLFVLCPGDREEPTLATLLEDWTIAQGAQLIEKNGELVFSGWLWMMAAVDPELDRSEPLQEFLDRFETVLKPRLGKLLQDRGIHKLTIVPHGFMRLAPFWAVPCLQEFDIAVAISAAHFLDTRRAEAKAVDAAMVVGDPIHNLPGTRGETANLTTRLKKRGLSVVLLMTNKATKSAVYSALGRARLFHFSGHGRVRGPLDAALLLSPDWAALPVSSEAAFWGLSPPQGEWEQIADDVRRARLPGNGLLEECRSGEGVERILRYAPTGTLWAMREGDSSTPVAELWTAGDMLAGGGLEGCELALLAACSLGSGGFSEVEEWEGIPAALQLSGVSTVVASLWPVSDRFAVIYVSLFYEALIGAGEEEEVDVPRVLRDVGAKLRAMDRQEAAQRLMALAEASEDAFAALALERYALQLQEGPEKPFAHPYCWATFYALGQRRLKLKR